MVQVKQLLPNHWLKSIKRKGVIPIPLDGGQIKEVIHQNRFDEESRKKNTLNDGYIELLLESQGNFVIVSLISPYADIRNEIRGMCKKFVGVHVSTYIKDCIVRDPKGIICQRRCRGDK